MAHGRDSGGGGGGPKSSARSSSVIGFAALSASMVQCGHGTVTASPSRGVPG